MTQSKLEKTIGSLQDRGIKFKRQSITKGFASDIPDRGIYVELKLISFKYDHGFYELIFDKKSGDIWQTAFYIDKTKRYKLIRTRGYKVEESGWVTLKRWKDLADIEIKTFKDLQEFYKSDDLLKPKLQEPISIFYRLEEVLGFKIF